MSNSFSNRRDFLTAKLTVDRLCERVQVRQVPNTPSSAHTLRLTQRAMACDFSVIMNVGVPKEWVQEASGALDTIGELERQISVYLVDSELTQLNRRAADEVVSVESRLFELLQYARSLSLATDRAFDPTSGPLVALWRACRDQDRIPTHDEVDACLHSVGIDHVRFDDSGQTIEFDRVGVELNLGGIGKGYALDRAGVNLVERGLEEWLLHGGHSSLLARGRHNKLTGWPVGIGNPLFTGQRLGTILLEDGAMATSGSNIQYFHHRGRKYGHILDPRTGWPIETMLSATVLAPTAAQADAFSTAFYVMGVEKAIKCCNNLAGVGAILIPFPNGRQLDPIIVGIPEDRLFLDSKQVAD